MNTNCEQVLLKGTLGELVSQNIDLLWEFYTEFDSDTLQNSAVHIGRVLSQFQTRSRGA